ncbi:hypothetical protein [Corallococcus coralloides]|uniref:hypothetical protein n=1 Tax=Corallococcus coralloides TaxID=184914 RepID=UPI0005B8D074|nr:hypothetical protein [Corallococcus coralloides]
MQNLEEKSFREEMLQEAYSAHKSNGPQSGFRFDLENEKLAAMQRRVFTELIEKDLLEGNIYAHDAVFRITRAGRAHVEQRGNG